MNEYHEDTNPTLFEILASRLCHDLISPVGAVCNGVEFYEEMGADAADDAVQLISHSANIASGKLKAFRLAYGAGGRDPNIKLEEVHEAFDVLVGLEGKVTQDWDPHSGITPDPKPEAYCKLVMCTLILGMETLPKGGVIRVHKAVDSENTTHIVTSGETVLLRENVKEALDNSLPLHELDPRLVHAYVSGYIAKECGQAITVTAESDTSITFALGPAA